MDTAMRRRRPVFAARLALLTAVLAGGLCPAASGQSLSYVDILDVCGPQVHFLGGLTYSDSSLWIGDAAVEYYYYGTDGEGEWIQPQPAWVHRIGLDDGCILETIPIPGVDWPQIPPTGLASDGSNLYAASRTWDSRGIVEFAPGGAAAGMYDFQGTEPGTRAAGLTHDGSYLWQANYSPAAGHLYAIDTATNQRVNDLQVDPYPFGLAWDGRYFYASHHDRSAGTSYIAQYDRSGARLARLELPEFLSGSPIGDLAVNGLDLYAHVLGTNAIVHMELPPPAVTAPPLPGGVLQQATTATATLAYSGTTYWDHQHAQNPDELPVAASLSHSADGAQQMQLLGKARSHFDEVKIHNTLHALGFGDSYPSEATADADLAVSKQIVVAPQPGLPAGTPVWSRATLTINGLLQACRTETGYEEYTENGGYEPTLPEASGLRAAFAVEITKVTPSGPAELFYGLIALTGRSSEEEIATGEWVDLLVQGDFAAFATAARGDLVVQPDFATLPLDEVELDFFVPVVIGVPFDVDFVFHGEVRVPALAAGLGAEVAFGEDPLLYPGYLPPLDAPYYTDGFVGDWQWRLEFYVPEPTAALLLVAAAGLIRRRSRRLQL